MKEGKPIWSESLFTIEEWRAYHTKYGTPLAYPPSIFECDFKWRFGMGAVLSEMEIAIINTRLNATLKKAGL